MPQETERKYVVDDSTALPELLELPGVAKVDQPVELRLVATYFDTPDLALTRSSITLRQRTGGTDDGWHLKLPDTDGNNATLSRNEIRHPLTSDDSVPPELVQLVRGHVRDHPLQPLAEIQTRRITHTLRDGHGEALAELDDDHVTTSVSGHDTLSWREWELELLDADRGFLAATHEHLTSTGALPGDATSKLQRTLAETGFSTARLRPPRTGAAARMVLEYVGAQTAELARLDAAVRMDQPDSVHRMRVATRRVRSVLRTYRAL